MNTGEARLIGVFGGTFDPIHYGHLRVAEEVVEMVRLVEMRFVPAGNPRLRHAPAVSPQHRAAIVSAAIQDNARFMLDEREVHGEGISYSVQSLRELRQELGMDVILCFVLGADAFMRLNEWHCWRDLFDLCHLIVAARQGHTLEANSGKMPEELAAACATRWVRREDDLRDKPSGLIFIAPTTLLDISATAIRDRAATGMSLRYLVPDAALGYIANHHLYSGKG